MFSSELTKKLAELSKISFTADELDEMTNDMAEITALMDTVCSFDCSIPPYMPSPVSYKDLRNDTPEPSYNTEEILKNASKTQNNSFSVPKVV